ncbi:MAG: hydroxyacylglutathione hydrolase [Candidatus Hydrogenedentota bacterium]|nr:MAG: hydroxyacylglutathione hydrolase [Candidatus Hydrogenedentota bacterium]
MYAQVDIIPVLSDNYCYAVHARDRSAVALVDPGETQSVMRFLSARRIIPTEIWLTHKHSDHIAGAVPLAQRYGIPVRAPSEVPDLEVRCFQTGEGDRFPFGPTTVEVREVVGHTRGHVVYFVEDIIFSGDALFLGGCGRLFEGTAAEMYESLERVFGTVPDNVRLYCGHEYAEKNLRFALEIEPDNPRVRAQYNYIKGLRAEGRPSVPGEMGRERQTNPFLRTRDRKLIESLKVRKKMETAPGLETFAALRSLRDRY